MLVSSSVWPSGCAFATAAVPILVEAPGRLMMTKRWRSRFAQALDEHARDQVGAAAGRERHDDLDRAARIVLRRAPADGEQRKDEKNETSHRAAIANYCGAASGISARSE